MTTDVEPTIPELATRIHDWAVEKGWWEEGRGRDEDEIIFLVVGELAEAYEEYRHDRMELWYSRDKQGNDKPEGFCIELADAVIRILDYAAEYKLELFPLTLHELSQLGNNQDVSIARQFSRISSALLMSCDQPLSEGDMFANTAMRDILTMLWKYSNYGNPWTYVRMKMEYNATRPYRHGNLKA